MGFKLTKKFIDKYRNLQPAFGFGGLSEFVYFDKYSRVIVDEKTGEKRNEVWFETIQRVVEGIYTLQKEHIEHYNLGWHARQAQKSAQEMYDRMFHMKFLPAGRGLWAMGTDLVMKKRLFAPLYNCMFVSTEKMDKEPIKPFAFMMDMSMLGCLAPDTSITTSDGVRQIKELDGVPTTVMVNGKPYLAPIGSWCSGVKDMYKVSTKEGHTISLTGDHRILRYNDNFVPSEDDWVTVDELVVGDKVVIHNHEDKLNWEGFGTYEQGYLVGIFWGDGYFSRDPLAAVHDKDIGSEGIAEEALMCVASVRRNKDAKGWRRKGKTPVRELSIGTWVKDFGIYVGNKIVTPQIEQTSKDFHRGFIRGAFDADGCVSNHEAKSTRSIRLSQTSYEDLQAIQRMLLKFGIFSKIYKKRDVGVQEFPVGRLCKTKACWELCITRNNILKFAKHIGFSHSIKADKLSKILKKNFYKTNFCATISSIEFDKESEVWDMGVDEINAMDANGFYVHNCGVGVDTLGADKVLVKGIDKRRKVQVFVIGDDRESWVKSVEVLLESYFYGMAAIEFDYTQIREKGTPLKTFGGVASGPDPLIELHKELCNLLDTYVGDFLSTRGIVDIFNMIGKCVVSGNIRRTASIVLGSPDDEEYLDLKNYAINPERAKIGWLSNNSITATVGMDYTKIAERIINNGEPGVVWLENCREYSRMNGISDWKDSKVAGVNPCGEVPLESFEACNLTEVFLNHAENEEDFLRTLKFAYLYVKSVTLGQIHNVESNRVMSRNRKVGCSVTSIAQFFHKHGGVGILKTWLSAGYDELEKWDKEYSNWLCIPRSLKLTTNKPSGTVSLLASSTPGIHYPISRFYIRRVRVASTSGALLEKLRDSGYDVEPDVNDPDNTFVVSFPVDVGESVIGGDNISLWEQLSLAALMQKYWSDNSVSFTCTFNPEIVSKEELARALDYFQWQLKSASFMPRIDIEEYPQMPYEKLTEEAYNEMLSKIKPVDYSAILKDAEGVKFCNSDSCEV